MKTIAATLLALGLITGAAQARMPQDVFTDIAQTAPRSIFDQINETAPRAPFDQINSTAPRSIFDDLRDSAPRTDGVFGDIQKTAP